MAVARAWDAILPDDDRAVFDAAGYGQRAGAGIRPALLVVDVTYDFVGDRPEPILESIRRFPYSCGEVGWQAMERIRVLLDAARDAGAPVFYSRSTADGSAEARGGWARKNARDLDLDLDPGGTRAGIGNDFPDLIAPRPGDTIIEKAKPSAFFGSTLASALASLSIDTLIVAGTTTSGCVRATVVDAFSLDYRVVVAEDAVFDRGRLAHLASLFDMHAKYADVQSVAEIVEYLGSLRSALPVEPPG